MTIPYSWKFVIIDPTEKLTSLKECLEATFANIENEKVVVVTYGSIDELGALTAEERQEICALIDVREEPTIRFEKVAHPACLLLPNT